MTKIWHSAETVSEADRSAPNPTGATQTIVEQVAGLLGEQSAEIMHAIDSRFRQLHAHLDGSARSPSAVPATLISSPSSTGNAHMVGPRPSLDTSIIYSFEPPQSWDGWQHHQEAKIKPGGQVEINQEASTAGVKTDALRLPESGLFRVKTDIELVTESNGPSPILRVQHEQELLGPDALLQNGQNEIYLFVPNRITELQLLVLVNEPKLGVEFVIRKVIVEKVDHESYYAHVRHNATTPVIASMASIPVREPMLRDAVACLLLQCDRVRVFLNDYADVPDFLRHPRVDVKRSQDFDDKGDAGKFGWIDTKEPAGFRVIADDDLIFSPDFVENMTKRAGAYGDKVILCTHGVTLRQPIVEYYNPVSRSVVHFQSRLPHDRTVHVAGTNSIVYHSEHVRMTWADFMFRNMADIFLARYAQEKCIPIVAVERPQFWVRQNTQEGGFESIYESSLKRTRSKFDSSLLQDGVVRRIAPLTTQPTVRPKVAVCLIATSTSQLNAALESFERTCGLDFDWVVLLTPGNEDPALRDHMATVNCVHELHIVAPAGARLAERIARMFELAGTLKLNLVVIALDAIRFESGSWTRNVLGINLGEERGLSLTVNLNGNEEIVVTAGAPAQNFVAGAMLLDGRALRELAVPGLGGEGLLRAFPDNGDPRPRQSSLPPAVLRAAGEGIGFDRLTEARALARDADTAGSPAPTTIKRPNAIPALAINDIFERVIVINLDRRPDRWAQMSQRLETAGIRAERFPAVDGRAKQVATEFEEYAKQPLAQVSAAVRPIRSSWDFFNDYDSQRARLAYLEANEKTKAIRSAGAWAYLRTWEQILEQAVTDQLDSLLIFDDDVAFHRQTPRVFAAVAATLPDDWLVLQLGTLQYHWTEEWISPQSRFLYRSNGSAIGSHAVGLRFDAFPFLLDHIKRMELPLDIGALSAATHAFSKRCFVTLPNLAIQQLADSDIRTSDFQRQRSFEESAQVYRWNLEDYDLSCVNQRNTNRRGKRIKAGPGR
jgi:GR25 family glycosyltransferase involved in LPS biosynthesis